MDAKYRLLGRRRRARIRHLARECYLANQGSEQAKVDAEDAIRREFGSILVSILIGLAIKLAVELIAYWIKQRLSDPGVGFQSGEPGGDE